MTVDAQGRQESRGRLRMKKVQWKNRGWKHRER